MFATFLRKNCSTDEIWRTGSLKPAITHRVLKSIRNHRSQLARNMAHPLVFTLIWAKEVYLQVSVQGEQGYMYSHSELCRNRYICRDIYIYIKFDTVPSMRSSIAISLQICLFLMFVFYIYANIKVEEF